MLCALVTVRPITVTERLTLQGHREGRQLCQPFWSCIRRVIRMEQIDAWDLISWCGECGDQIGTSPMRGGYRNAIDSRYLSSDVASLLWKSAM